MLVPVKQDKTHNEQPANHKELTPPPKQLESIPDEHFQMINDPLPYALEAALADFLNDPKPQTLDQIHLILLTDSAQFNPKVQKMVCKLLPFIHTPELYDPVCLVLSDVSHYNPGMVKLLLDLSVFSELDYSKDITFCFVLSLCDGNEEAWRVFRDLHWRAEFEDNKYLKMLSGNI